MSLAGKEGDPFDFPCTLLSIPNSYGGEGAAYLVRTGGPKGTVVMQSVEQVLSIRLPDAGGDILSKPTLNWAVQAGKSGKQDIELAYQTEGITWRSDYSLVLSPDEKTGDVTAWVSVLNQTGLAFEDAKLKLVAGKVRRYSSRQRVGQNSGAGLFGGSSEPVEEQAFFDYHLYTVQRPTSLPNNSTKQIELFSQKRGVAIEKGYMWTGPAPQRNDLYNPDADMDFGTGEPGGIHILVRMKNSADKGLGLPLPAGLFRVYKADPVDGAREFVGEDIIDHTPVDEPVILFVGTAFDLLGDRTRTKFERENNSITESFEISIRNRKQEPAKVIVRETMYRWVNWKLIDASQKWTSPNAQKVDFEVDLPAGAEKKLSYTVVYSW